jgi:hypothetical protein
MRSQKEQATADLSTPLGRKNSPTTLKMTAKANAKGRNMTPEIGSGSIIACYDSLMTRVEILFRCSAAPAEQSIGALARMREVYGIFNLSFDRAALTLRVDYDATRLNAATVQRLVGQCGCEVVEVLSPVPAPAQAPAA